MSMDAGLSVLSNSSNLQSSSPESSSLDVNQIMQSFSETLRLSMLAQMMSSLNSSSSNTQADNIGASTSSSEDMGSSMMTLVMSLYDQLLSQQVQQSSYGSDTDSDASDPLLRPIPSGGAANLHHINQFTAELQVGGDGANADCGPTSLVMALHQLGLRVAGETSSTNDGQAVDLARLSMAAGSATDGVDAYGNRSDAEHNTYTNFSDLARGAAAAGAKSQVIQADAASIQSALQNGASVVASGTFTGKYPLPWTGDRGTDNNSAPGHATAHIIEISSYDSSTNTFLINDPARNQSNRVTADALEKFMSGNAGAIAIRK